MTKKTLLEIDLNVLSEYEALQNLNKKNWDIAEYLNLKYDINAAVSFSKLYFPDFIEKEGCVILAFRYNEDIYNQWKLKFNGNKSEIERMCNFYEVNDYFDFTKNEYNSAEHYEKYLQQLSCALRTSWQINLNLLYPNRKFIVEVFEEYETKRITLYSQE